MIKLGNFTNEQIFGFRLSKALDCYAARVIETQIKHPELDKARYRGMESAKEACQESILALVKKGGF